MLRILPPMFKPVNNLIFCKTGLMWVVKRATSLFNSFCSNVAKQVARFLLPVFAYLRACLHGGGGPQVGEVKYGGSPNLSCKRDQIKMRDYMDNRVTPPKRVASPTWGPPPACKQALKR